MVTEENENKKKGKLDQCLSSMKEKMTKKKKGEAEREKE